MSLTPAEQRELERINRELRALQAQEAGNPAAEEHIASVSKPASEESSGFSFMRLVLGTGRDIIDNALQFGRDAIEFNSRNSTLGRVGDGVELGDGDILPNIEGSENAAAAEQITRSIAGYLAPYTGWAKGFKVAKGATFLSRTGRAAAAGAATTLTTQDPQEANLANVIRDTFGVDQEWLDAVASDEDEDVMVQRLKAAATDAGFGVLADSVFRLGGKLVQAYKGVRGEADEARQIVEAIQHDYGVKVIQRVEAQAPTADELLNPAALDEAVPEKAPFDPAKHVSIDNQPESWEDVLSLLTRAAGDHAKEAGETLEDTLAAIAHGDPDNILVRAGINPKNLNWDDFETPEAVRRLHAALTEASEQAARGLGRTGERVPHANLHVAARSLASDVEVLKALYGRTSNLPEVLTGARMLVGSHARVLLDSAEEALEALLKDGSKDAWDNFLRTFHRHALYVGAVRGAGSEIGRALNSLKMVIRAGDQKTGLKEAERVAELANPDKVSKVDPKELADDELNAVLSIETDAERIMLLNKLLDKGGDIGELAQFVRQKNGSALKRIDDATRETMGNLFSQATAAFNIASGVSFLGMRALGRWMATAARLGLAPFSSHQALQARVAMAEAWAYTDGMVMAWKDAISNTLAVLEKEGASELFVNADTLGLDKVAKMAAKAQAEGRSRMVGDFVRVDLDSRPRALALNPADRRALNEWIENHSLPQLLERSLKWLTRSGGVALNAAGTIQRTGKILFIDAPDQFVGTMAARAGAQAAAVREAAKQAAELGIEGKDLSKFLKARVASLSSDVDGWADQGFEEGFRETVYAAGEHEAREILFQDPLETRFSRKSAQLQQQTPGFHLLVPFVHTPLRILERTAFDYTPLGIFRKRIRDAVLHGTPAQRDQALTQLTLGVFGMYLGYRLAADRTVVGQDNRFFSTARPSRESYSVRIGADVVEFLRTDPLGTLLGFGADLHAFLETAANEPNRGGEDHEMSLHETAWELFVEGSTAFAANMLNKTWFQSLRDLVDLSSAATQGEGERGLEKWVASFGRRAMPGAGVQKGLQQLADPYERDARTFFENALKASVGASTLPIKRDFLGRPLDHNLGERFTGLTWQPEKTDVLSREFEKLAFVANMPSRTLRGVKLNAVQFNRLLQIRGEEVTVPRYGLPLREALESLFELPEYQALRKEAKIAQIRKVFEGYTKAANTALLAEDPELAAKVRRKEAFTDGRAANMSDEQIEQRLQEFAAELGLEPEE